MTLNIFAEAKIFDTRSSSLLANPTGCWFDQTESLCLIIKLSIFTNYINYLY